MIHPLRLAAVLASFLLLGAAALERQRDALARDPEYIVLDSDADAFRERFNADVGKTRILMLVSPTCGGCLRGADQTQKKVLSRIDSDGLDAYEVWVPANGARERHMPRVLDASAEAQEWRCAFRESIGSRSSGTVCGFDGEALCQVEVRRSQQIEVCP